jgi:predicted HicB family RNase H-like nuclease
MDTYSCRLLWSDEDGGYIATSPEFTDLSAFGTTAAEAVTELEALLEDAAGAYHDSGWPLPSPLRVREYSGQLRLRLPRSLHGRLVEEAELDGVSLNTLIVSWLAERAGQAAAETAAPGVQAPWSGAS